MLLFINFKNLLSKRFKYFFYIAYFIYLVNDWLKFCIICIISTIISKICIVHKLIEVFFDGYFCILSFTLIIQNKVSFKMRLFKSKTAIYFCHFLTTSFNKKSQVFQIKWNKLFWEHSCMRLSSTSMWFWFIVHTIK